MGKGKMDARGYIAVGCFLLVLTVLGIVVFDKTLLESDAFLILATAIIITGWVNGPVGWAYQATKGGGEAADSNARVVERMAEHSSPDGQTQDVRVVNEPEEPVPTETLQASGQEELPDYAR